MNNTLHPRYIAPQLKVALADTPVVCLLGPRQVGKTTLAKALEPSTTAVDTRKLHFP
ncbi:hypothetical protein [Photorhabdus temperata]|uniref:hypothetical protein n=1 Tax=Photorhabdus temperata TaxID=574560 RepID=UPI001E5AB8B4|nr:hypothetical protein [Photorhabdus temperata]